MSPHGKGLFPELLSEPCPPLDLNTLFVSWSPKAHTKDTGKMSMVGDSTGAPRCALSPEEAQVVQLPCMSMRCINQGHSRPHRAAGSLALLLSVLSTEEQPPCPRALLHTRVCPGSCPSAVRPPQSFCIQWVPSPSLCARCYKMLPANQCKIDGLVRGLEVLRQHRQGLEAMAKMFPCRADPAPHRPQ